MRKDSKYPLKVIQEANTPSAENTAPIPQDKEEPVADPEKKSAFALPEGYLLAQEMKDIFDEDIVTHVQGSAEPEAD